jgi:hypothetical protein
MVPSTMDSPIWGMMMSVGMISFHGATVLKNGLGANEYYSGGKNTEAKARVRCEALTRP